MSSSNQFSITINPSGVIPANTVTLIGSNTFYSTTPVGFTNTQWQDGVFGSFGGGSFVPGYGPQGGYIHAGTGGHVPGQDIVDGVVFDFETEQWSRLVNTNGAANLAGATYNLSQTNGSPYYEILSGGVTTYAPAPSHCYLLPMGVGANLIMPIGFFMTSSIAGSPVARKFATDRINKEGTWSRLSTPPNNHTGGGSTAERGCLYDARGNRLWMFGQACNYYIPMTVFNLPTGGQTVGTWQTISMPDNGNGNGGGVDGSKPYGHYVFHDNGTTRCILFFWADATQGRILNITTDVTAAAGWQPITLSGAPGWQMTRWAYYDPAYGGDGCHYTLPRSGTDSTVWKLTPPENLLSDPWEFSTITPSGTFPQRPAIGYGAHYTCFMFVPARQAFAWVAGGGTQVALWRPA